MLWVLCLFNSSRLYLVYENLPRHMYQLRISSQEMKRARALALTLALAASGSTLAEPHGGRPILPCRRRAGEEERGGRAVS